MGDSISHILMNVVIFSLWPSLQILAGSVPPFGDSTVPSFGDSTVPSRFWISRNLKNCTLPVSLHKPEVTETSKHIGTARAASGRFIKQ